MDRDRILAIDVGTQSARVRLFGRRGNPGAKARVPMEPYFSDQPGWAEQQPEYYWARLAQACRQLWQQNPGAKETVAGVALTTQRATVINVDREGRPLRPAIVWLGPRRPTGSNPGGARGARRLRVAG